MPREKLKAEEKAQGRNYTLNPELIAYLDWKVSAESKPWSKAKYSRIVADAIWRMMQSDREYQEFLATKESETIRSENKP